MTATYNPSRLDKWWADVQKQDNRQWFRISAEFGEFARTISGRDDIIGAHLRLAAGNGFVTGLGGFVTLPIALPANVAGFYIVATRMAGAIAAVRVVVQSRPSKTMSTIRFVPPSAAAICTV